MFVSEANRSGSIPAQGAIFLSRRTKTDWIHTGLFSSFSDETFKTIEGNTNDEGSREAFEVCARTQEHKKKDLIRIEYVIADVRSQILA